MSGGARPELAIQAHHRQYDGKNVIIEKTNVKSTP